MRYIYIYIYEDCSEKKAPYAFELSIDSCQLTFATYYAIGKFSIGHNNGVPHVSFAVIVLLERSSDLSNSGEFKR